MLFFSLTFFYPNTSTFSFWVGNLLPEQDLGAIKFPFDHASFKQLLLNFNQGDYVP